MTCMAPEWARDRLNTIESRRTAYPASTLIALEALAADTLEYGVADANGDIVRFPVDSTVGTAEDAHQDAVNYANSDPLFRLVARRVSAPWEVAG